MRSVTAPGQHDAVYDALDATMLAESDMADGLAYGGGPTRRVYFADPENLLDAQAALDLLGRVAPFLRRPSGRGHRCARAVR